MAGSNSQLVGNEALERTLRELHADQQRQDARIEEVADNANVIAEFNGDTLEFRTAAAFDGDTLVI